MTVNDPPVGRSVDEVLRLVEAYQFTDKHGNGKFWIMLLIPLVCPANWKKGGKTINPAKKEEYFSSVYSQ